MSGDLSVSGSQQVSESRQIEAAVAKSMPTPLEVSRRRFLGVLAVAAVATTAGLLTGCSPEQQPHIQAAASGLPNEPGKAVQSVNNQLKVKEGTIPFRGYQTWYRIVGEESEKPPVLVLHGGPGFPHFYLKPLEDLARSGRQVIFYDQIGCGNSSRPDKPAMWNMEFFRDELQNVRKELNLNRFYLLGHSWGGMLAMEEAVGNPKGIEGLIVASSPASIDGFTREVNRLRKELPIETQKIMTKHEKAGTTDSKEYQSASEEFYAKHLCRVDPWPDYVLKSLEETGEQVYSIMNGPSEFHVIGRMKNWSVADRLGRIKTPTLVISGEYDEVTPALSREVHRGIRGSELVIVPDSSHFAFVEQRDKYLGAVEKFLSRHDK